MDGELRTILRIFKRLGDSERNVSFFVCRCFFICSYQDFQLYFVYCSIRATDGQDKVYKNY